KARGHVRVDVDLAQDRGAAANQYDELRLGVEVAGQIIADGGDIRNVLVLAGRDRGAAHAAADRDAGVRRVAAGVGLEHELVAVAISLALSAAVEAVALPLFLDTTGTILATALAGPSVGVAVGVLTSAVNTLRNPTFWPFVVIQIIVALYAGLAARAGLFRGL